MVNVGKDDWIRLEKEVDQTVDHAHVSREKSDYRRSLSVQDFE